MKQIAVYGKGGIGKSTISANLSAAIATYHKKVLQIGCDPKHDSTRLLMQGKSITTVLDYIRSTNPLDYKAEDILFHGYKGIGCVEAGGPTPGVGCAGRGIITTFELLDSFKIKDDYDYIIYDVLGDVVCGGFAVPIREEYADTIFIVTSGEYMSLYAANNILRGIQNYENSGKRIGGIIFNKRNVHDEDNRVKRFAEAVKLPIFMEIPRSDQFSTSEKANMTLIEKFDQSEIKDIFKNFAREIINGIDLHKSNPIAEEDIENIILLNNRSISIKSNSLEKEEKEVVKEETRNFHGIDAANPNRYLSKSIITEEPLHGCAFNGAVSMSIHIKDAVVLAHSPKSCTYISYQSITSPGRRGLFERGALLPVSISPNFECTYMKEADMVFGGMELLTDKIKEIKADSPKVIIVVSSCPSGIIGDDIDRVKSLADDNTPIITIKADGNMAGDYLQGMFMSYMTLAKSIIKPNVKKIPDTVNIVFEKVIAKNNNRNFETVENYLNQMGIQVNCRFICETSYEKIENFLSAPINILGYDDYTGNVLKDFFQKEYDCKFLDKPFPIGFEETKIWLESLGRVFHKVKEALTIIEDNERIYNEYIEELIPVLKGKRLFIITYNHDLDWILKTASDIGVEIVKIGILNYSQDIGFRTNLNLDLNVEENYNKENIERDIKTYHPDIVLTNYVSSLYNGDYISDNIPMCPDTGFYSGVIMAQRWAKLIKLNIKGEWSNDERLFKKYYTG